MIYLERFVDYGKPDEGTFGHLYFDDFFCYTVERPWIDNKPFISCIPEGDYFLEYYDSPRFGPSVILEGDTVSKFPNSNFKRSSILIHPANFSSDVQGCIGLGDNFVTMNGRAAVSNSRKTVERFLNLININEKYNLRIYFRNYETT